MNNPRRLVEAVEVTEGGIHIVRLMRIFDAASVNEFEKVLAYLMARGHFKLVVDLTNVEFVASAGWGALTAEFRRVHDNGGDIRLAGMNPDVLDVFFLLELDSFMSAYDTLDAALSSFELEQPHIPDWNKAETGTASFATMAATAPSEPESVAVADPLPSEPPLQKEVKHKKGSRAAAKTAQHENAEEAPATDEAAAASQAAMPPALKLAPQNNNPAPGEIRPVAAHPTAPTLAAQNEEPPVFETEAGSEVRKKTRKNASAAIASKEAKPKKKAQQPKSKSPRRARKEQEQESAAAISTGEESNAAAAQAPALLVSEPAVALNGDSRDTTRLSAVEPHAELAPEDIEMQDIHDPWLIDEIDSLPEEFDREEEGWQSHIEFMETDADLGVHEEAVLPMRASRPLSGGDFQAPQQAQHTNAPAAAATPPAAAFNVPPAPVSSSKARTTAKKAAAPKSQRPSRKHVSASDREAAPTEVMPELGDLPIARQASVKSRDRAGAISRPLQESVNIVKISSEGDYVELVRQIVKEHPQYGPTMIGKFFETRVDPPVRTSRSTIYRWLRLAGLNTRDQRLGFAGNRESINRE